MKSRWTLHSLVVQRCHLAALILEETILQETIQRCAEESTVFWRIVSIRNHPQMMGKAVGRNGQDEPSIPNSLAMSLNEAQAFAAVQEVARRERHLSSSGPQDLLGQQFLSKHRTVCAVAAAWTPELFPDFVGTCNRPLVVKVFRMLSDIETWFSNQPMPLENSLFNTTLSLVPSKKKWVPIHLKDLCILYNPSYIKFLLVLNGSAAMSLDNNRC